MIPDGFPYVTLNSISHIMSNNIRCFFGQGERKKNYPESSGIIRSSGNRQTAASRRIRSASVSSVIATGEAASSVMVRLPLSSRRSRAKG